MLVHIKDLFKDNFSGEYAIPAFNTQNLETTIAIIKAAVAQKAPVIIQVSQSTLEYAGMLAIESLIVNIANAEDVNVPIALHLDHTKDIEAAEKAIDAGFSSVMIDGSDKPYEENVKKTRNVVEYAHTKGAWVQGELGRLRGTEDWVSVTEAEELFTDPDDAKNFVEQTQVDTLAIAVGTIHGIIKMRDDVKPKLDIDRIKKTKEKLNIPLVLHGASGVHGQQLKDAISAGISIVNIDTELRLAFTEALREKIETDPEEVDPRKILTPSIEAVQKAAEEKLQELGASGKA